jgi:hypothetical protein
MRLAVLFALAVAGCSSGGDALVVVTVSSSMGTITGINKLRATVTAAGHTAPLDVSMNAGAPFDIPPNRTFGIEVPEGLVGAFTIDLDALGAGDVVLASGSDSDTTSAGKRTDVEIDLTNGVINMDLGGDGGRDAAGDGGDMSCVPQTCLQANYGCGMLNTCGMDIDCGACVLASVHPSVANTGDTIILEGRFNPNVAVIFPGNVSVMPTLLGPGRATVVVPATATAGAIAIQLAGGSPLFVKQFFRRASFALGLHDFRNTYEQTDTGRPMPVLPRPLGNGGSAVIGQTVQLFGGFDYNAGPTPSPAPTVQSSWVHFDGSVDTFNIDNGKGLVTPRGGFATYTCANGVYVIGGYDGGAVTYKSVEKAPIHGDGSGIDTFQVVSGVELNAGRYFAGSAVIGPWLYVFGGVTGALGAGSLLKSIERAPINTFDGSLGPFEMVPIQTSLARAGSSALVLRDKVYLIGGLDSNGSFSTQIEEATINGDGSIGAFAVPATITTSLQADRAVAGIVQLGTQIFILGGASSTAVGGNGNPSNSIERATLNTDGSLGSFTLLPITMKAGRLGQPLIIGNYLYYAAAGGDQSDVVERSSIIATGSLGAFADTGRTVTPARVQMATAVVGNGLYIIGGAAGGTTFPTIQRAQIDPDGTLGNFVNIVAGKQIPDLLHERSGAATAVIERTVYVCGGTNSSGRRTDCESFRVEPDGTVNLQPTPPPMTTKRAGFNVAALGKNLYAIGGDLGGWSTVERIPLDVNQRPNGNWAPQPSPSPVPFASISSGRHGVVIGDHHYMISGDATPQIDAALFDGTQLLAYGNKARFMTEWRFDGALLNVGPRIYQAGGKVTGTTTPSANVERADTDINLGELRLLDFTDAGADMMHARFGHSAVVLGNFAYVISGNDGNGPIGSIEVAPIQ